MNIPKAFESYIATAAQYALRKIGYTEVEKSRAALCLALGYPRVTDHLGEFCNLHERDIPGHKSARKEGPDAYRYSGYFAPVTGAELAKQLEAYERQSVELIRWFQIEPVERFIAGDRVIYPGFDGKTYMAQFIKAEAPHLRIREIIDLFEYPIRMEPIMGEVEARSFFADLPRPFFTAHFKDA